MPQILYCFVTNSLNGHRSHVGEQRADDKVRKEGWKEAGLGHPWRGKRTIKGLRAFHTERATTHKGRGQHRAFREAPGARLSQLLRRQAGGRGEQASLYRPPEEGIQTFPAGDVEEPSV